MLKTVVAVVSVPCFWLLYTLKTIYICAWLKIHAHGAWASQPTPGFDPLRDSQSCNSTPPDS